MARLRSLLLALAVFAWAASVGHATETASRIAAVVNDEIITVAEVESRSSLIIQTSGLRNEPRTRDRLRNQVLRGLIDEALQRQEAQLLRLAASSADVDRALAEVAERNGTDIAGLIRLVQRSGSNEQSLRRQLEAQIGWLRIINRDIRPRVRVSDAQVDAAFREATLAAANDEVRLGQILLPVYQPEQEDQVRRDAAEIVAQIRGGGSFEELARQFSQGQGADQGGDLGWLAQDALPEDLRRELARLQPGEITPPLRTASGIQIVMLRDRRSAQPGDSTGEPRVRLSQILLPVTGTSQASLAQAMQRAESLRPQLTSCAAVNQTAQRIGAEASGDLGWLRLRELPPGLARAISALPVGQISAPFRGPAGIQLLMVCERRGAFERPPPPTREAVQQRLEREQIERLAARYLRDLRRDAFIDIRL